MGTGQASDEFTPPSHLARGDRAMSPGGPAPPDQRHLDRTGATGTEYVGQLEPDRPDAFPTNGGVATFAAAPSPRLLTGTSPSPRTSGGVTLSGINFTDVANRGPTPSAARTPSS